MKLAEMQVIINKDNSNGNPKNYSDANLLNERLINDKGDYPKSKSKAKIIMLIIIIFLIIALATVTALFFYLRINQDQDEKESIEKEYAKEDLIVNINYRPNMIYRYILRKNTLMNVEGVINKDISTKTAEQFSEIFLFIKQENIEKDEIKLKSKKWFTGYLAILNLSLIYENNNTQVIEDKKLYNILNEKTESLDNMDNLSFVKIDFYENGDIKDFYIPKNQFSILNMQYMKEYSNLIFPKISSELYSNSIEQSLNELIVKKKNIRRLNDEINNNKLKTYKILSNNNDNSQEFEMEESILPSNDKSKYYDLREKSNAINATNLIEFSTGNVESKEVNFKNSELNKTINTTINKDGLLDSVKEIEKVIILNEENNEDDISELLNDNKTEINFGIQSMSFETIYELNIKDNFTDEKIINNLLSIFENITYELFNVSYYNEYMSLLIKEKMIQENNLSNESYIRESDENNNLRRMSSSSKSYYGMNKLVNQKDLYNYNFLGMKMQKQIFNELDPSTGKSSTYFNLIFGNINTKIKTSEQNSNLHIILKNKNKMAFNLIQLLYKTNLDLKQRNKNISEIIINLENRILESLKDYDYSNSFNECLNQVSDQLNIFTSDLFDQLIVLINNLYENYTIILKDIKSDKYEVFNKILNITKYEYMNYIYAMNNNLENFTNETLLFLESIEKEVNNLSKIEKIDFLYDILDNIYEGKLLLSQFNKNLFKAIEKGILTFQTDINEYKENLIGDLLYITDFLSVNIVKNEIIIRAYDESTLKDLSIKLKNFRNIIQTILDELIDKINSEYEFEMSQDNNCLKFFSESKALKHYNEVDKNSNNLVNKIKEKINYNDIYEKYVSNLDYINYINNKTIIDYINDMNNISLMQINSLQPEFIKKLEYNGINDNNLLNNNIINSKEKIIEKITISFFDNETKFLFNELRNIFNDSIELIKKNIDDNYQLGIDYINELYSYIIDKYNGNSYIGEGFYKKYQKFLDMYKGELLLNNSEILFYNLDYGYIKVKNITFNFLYENLTDNIFNDKSNQNISFFSEEINKYLSQSNFYLFKNELFELYISELEKYIEIKNISLEDKYNYLLNQSKGLYQTNSDYFVSSKDNGLLKTTNNFEKINLDINFIIELNTNNTKIIFENFENNVIDYLKEYHLKYIPIIYNSSLRYNDIFYQKEELFNITKLITKEINNEINDINDFINNYTNEYKKENYYDLHYYLYKINNLFFDNESNFLLSELREAFNYTIELHKKRIDENYKICMDYINELSVYICQYHAGDNIDLGRGALEKYIRFISLFEEYVSLANSEQIFNNLKDNYEKIKNEIFNFMKNKLSNIKEFYFGNDIYKNNFNFIKRINEELFVISDKINKHFNEDRFEFLKIELLPYSLNELRKYNEVYNKTLVETFEYIRAHTDGVYDTNGDFRYWYKTWYGHVKNRPNCYIPLTNNIDLINININHTIDYMNNITDIIIENFTIRIDEYLSKYISCVQNMYNNLYIYIDKKINNNNIQEMFNEYEETFIKILILNSNYALFEDAKNKLKEEKLLYLNNLENNINLLTSDFLNSYYLNSFDTFLEYPSEILNKIKQFIYELKDNIEMIRQKNIDINLNKIINIIKSTNIFIKDIINSHNKFILININNNNIMKEYFDSKNNFISNNFNKFIGILSKIENLTLNIFTDKNLIFTVQNERDTINNLYEKLEKFTNDLEYAINKNFTYQRCYELYPNTTNFINESDPYGNETNDINDTNKSQLVCETIKYKSNLSDYEYNYNIVKLRSGIFYTKTAFENIMNLFDDLNYTELLNIKKYNNIENELNDNNILDIYNSTIYKLKEINQNSNDLLEEQNEYFYKEILNIYCIDKDYYPYLKDFEKILKQEYQTYNDYYINYFNSKFNFIEPLLLDFNNTLFEQKNEYLSYYIDENNTFTEVYKEYQEQIIIIFENNKNDILNLKDSSYFLTSLKNYLSKLQGKKRNYFKEIINNISKPYNYQLLNMTINVGEIIENLLIKEYEEQEFSLVYEYIKMFDSYLNGFLNGLVEYISQIENDILNKFEIIYNGFLEKLYSDEIDKDFYNDIKENYTRCYNLSTKFLNETSINDKINVENYLNESINNNFNDINETELLIECIQNNYYNYSVKLYKNFDKKYIDGLDYIIKEINKLNMSDLFDILTYKYFEKYYEYDNYTLSQDTINDIYYKLFLAYDDIILYINYTQNNIYFDHLNNLLIESFKPSYIYYINNYLVPPLNENIYGFINNKAEIHLYYLMTKIKDEFYYYIIRLNNTKEIGKNSKESFDNLYDYVKKRIEQYIYYTINEYVLFYIDLFYKNNRYIFRDNYITYFANDLNVYNLKIHQLKEFVNENIYNSEFNKTLNEYSNELFNQLIITQLNHTINELLYDKLEQIYSTINELKIKMKDTLSYIAINEDNININNIISSYNVILKNQNNQFIFKVSEAPLEHLYYFIKDVLEPPLLEIKFQYNIIEKKILEKVLNITDNFPNFRDIIKEKLAIYDILDLIKLMIENLQNLLLKYEKDLNDDYDGYINKLIHYTYINGLNTYDKPCKYSFCSINITQIKHRIKEKNKNKNKDNVKEKITLKNSKKENRKYYKKNKDYSKIDSNSNFLFLKQLIETKTKYDETMGAISKEEIIPFLLEIKDTIFDLNKTYINTFDINGKLKTNIFISKINTIYKVKLKNTILKSSSKFSSILSRESYDELVNNMLKQYFELEKYLNNITVYLEKDMTTLIEILTNTSNFIALINDLSSDIVLGYFDILTQLIQDKYQFLTNDKNLRNLKTNEEEEEDDDDDEIIEPNEIDDRLMAYFEEQFKIVKDMNTDIFGEFMVPIVGAVCIVEGLFVDIMKNSKVDIEYEFEGSIEASIVLYKNKIAKLDVKDSNELNLFNLEFPIIFFFPIFPNLQLRIIPKVKVSIIFSMGFEMDLIKDDFSLYFEPLGEAEVSVSLEMGFYIPAVSPTLEISLTIGLKGVLGSGAVGMKTSLFLDEPKYEIELYYRFNAFSFIFYSQFNIKIKVGIFKFCFSFYLMYKELFGGFTAKKSIKTKISLKKIKDLTSEIPFLP